MARRRRFFSNTVRAVGALLPSDVLAKAMEGDGLEGMEPADFELDEGVRLRDEVNSAWNEATALWWSFLSELRDLPEDDATATALTREKWLLPLLRLLGFGEIETLGSAVTVGGTDYPISHLYLASPVHLMGARIGLDERAVGIRGAARLSPHSVTQQFLNRSDDHLWGVVSNGYRLRLLRDSVSLTRQAYVEFDLEAMFNGQVFADFVLLYRTAHATRFTAERPEECLLERWIAAARDEGIRALDRLRSGVEEALTALGTGFLHHRANAALRSAMETGDLDEGRLYRYLLRLVYRLLFLSVAEDRDLLLLPDSTPEQRDRYERFYSTGRLRDLAARPIGAGHEDLWEGLRALMGILGRDEGEPALGLPGLGSFLWSPDAIGPLEEAGLDNEDLLVAMRSLAHVDEDNLIRRIDFAGLGAEELGSVYESLLELHPAIDPETSEFLLGGGAGSERKTTGSYYTPSELISELLDSALMPVLEKAASSSDPEGAILRLKVVDPAAGSGHFLIAAAHRIAKRLAEVRTGEPEPPEAAYREALRDVISRCIFAVDVNELAVELCKVSLWLEALEPGRPLSFLDHHILVGNSLVGATPAAVASGIPDDAFVGLEGDEKETVSELRKRNRLERAGQESLALGTSDAVDLGAGIDTLEQAEDSDLGAVRAKAQMLAEWKSSPAVVHSRLVADVWCASFALRKRLGFPSVTDAAFRQMRDSGRFDEDLLREVDELRSRFKFFHWHLAFPQVFKKGDPAQAPGWTGGFDVVLGNPPWESMELREKEWFAERAPVIAEAGTAFQRRQKIDGLKESDPGLHAAFQGAVRDSQVSRHFVRRSGTYVHCTSGRVNTYTVFVERMLNLVGPGGNVGVIVPTGLATDLGSSGLFAELIDDRRLASLFDFENKRGLFRSVHRELRFCLLTAVGCGREVQRPMFVFFAHSTHDLVDPDRRFTLSTGEIRLMNPNTLTLPIFRTRRDSDLTASIYSQLPILRSTADAPSADSGWRFSLRQGLFNMASDSGLFHRSPESDDLEPGHLPLYEPKYIHQYDHRWGTFADGAVRNVSQSEKADPGFEIATEYSVEEAEVDNRLRDWHHEWLLAFRGVTNVNNARTVVAALIPRAGVGHNAGLIMLDGGLVDLAHFLLANLNSLVLDYAARNKLNARYLTFFVLEQLPVIGTDVARQPAPWDLRTSLAQWVSERVIRLSFTSGSLAGLGAEAGRPPYNWDRDSRAALMAELDAAFFYLYGLGPEDILHVMETFPLLRKNDEAEYGHYRTRDAIADIHHRMVSAVENEIPFDSSAISDSSF